MNYKERVHKFVSELRENTLFNGSGSSVYGWLFREYIFLTLLKDRKLNDRLCKSVEVKISYYEEHYTPNVLSSHKPYLQLLCFYLSYRNYFDPYSYISETLKFIANLDVKEYLVNNGCTAGEPGSGNLAMFLAIIIYNDKNDSNDKRLETWFDVMNGSQNVNGLWGSSHITYQLQNGYHQYEIYKFFRRYPQVDLAIAQLLKSQDEQGHFGPYLGGGGCYDYDAVDLLINFGSGQDDIKPALEKLYQTLLKEQAPDGGFCESPYIRNYIYSILRISDYTLKNFNIPRLKFLIRFFLGRVKVLQTHWSFNHRKYSESDAWNTWFRLITLVKIESYLNNSLDKSKVFNFPGIGF